jgi:hypothetical protein
MPKGMRMPGHRDDVLAVVRDLLAGYPTVVPGKMFGLPAFYTSGKLVASLYGDGLGVKLPPERVAALVGMPEYEPFDPVGRGPMRAWVWIRHADAAAYAVDLPLLLESVAYVAEEAASGRPPARRFGRRRSEGARR